MVGKSFENFKEHAAKEVTELQEYCADKVEGWAPSIEVDYASFQAANNGGRVYSQLCSWYNPMSRAVKRAVSNFTGSWDSAEELKTITTIKFEHHNDGFPVDDRWSLEDGVLTMKASFCCNRHSPDYYGFAKALAHKLRILAKGYKRDYLEKWVPKYNKRVENLMGEGKSLPVEVEWKTLEYKGWETDDAAYTRTVDAYYGLGGRYGYNSIEKVGDALRRSKETVEDITDAIEKFVFRNIKGKKNSGKKKCKYDHATKTMFLWTCFEQGYWGCCGTYEISDAIDMAVLVHKLGGNSVYESLTEEQHKRAQSMLKSTAESYSTRSGDVGALCDLMESPLYTKYDNVTYKAFIRMMRWVNSEKFQERFDDSPSEDEETANYKEPESSGSEESVDEDAEPELHEAYTEVFIHGWVASKLNFRGQFQERLVFVTNKALYSSKFDFKKNAPEGGYGDKGFKHLHRHNFEWARRIEVGECSAKAGAPAAPGGSAPKVPKIPGALAGKIPGGAATGGADFLFFYNSDRAIKEEKKRGKKKFKMPKIPNLKEKIVGALESAKEAIMGLSLPSISLPKAPTFSMPSISKLVDKAVSKFGKPDIPKPEVGTGGVGLPSPYACGANMPPAPEELSMWEKIKAKFAAMGIGSIGIPLPKIDLKAMFVGAIDKIKSAPVKIGLPKEMSITGILSGIAKMLNPATYGIPMPKIPSLSISSLFDAIKEAAGAAWEGVKDLCDSFVNGLKSIGAALVVGFKKLPKLPLKRVLNMIIDGFKAVADKIPVPKIDLPGVKLPSIKTPNMPKGPAIPAFLKSPKEPEFMRLQLRPICKNKAVSKWIALEMAYVVKGACAAYRKGYGVSVSEPSTISYESTVTAKAYNSMGKGSCNKPSKDIALTDLEAFVEKEDQFYSKIRGDVEEVEAEA